ncbi:MAG: hypothetical protein MUD12_15505 [Spirochaetes bacterium]|jgi:hypothetical protein|nr:hypothetical protein [Spirochaetota bacterium]
MMTDNKLRVPKKPLIMICGFILFLQTGLVSKDIQPEIHVFHAGMKNFGEHFINWKPFVSEKDLYNWAISNGLKLLEDQKPIIGRKALIISKYGSRIFVSGLERDRRYRMWIDFVLFRNTSRIYPGARLEIGIFNKKNGIKQLGDFIIDDLTGSPEKIDIPHTYSRDGSFDIIFREYSAERGIWGVWDVIISDGDEIPERRLVEDQSGNMGIKEKIVE